MEAKAKQGTGKKVPGKAKLEMLHDSGMYAVVRVRGSVKTNPKTEHTLRLLRLNSVNNCVLVPKRPDMQGMLELAKDFITWGEISEGMLERMIEKRGGGKKDLKIVFRLTPPSKGHRPIKSPYPKGACGYRGEKINELLERMI